MQSLLNSEEQQVSFIDYAPTLRAPKSEAPNFGRFTHNLDLLRAPLIEAILSLEMARGLSTYNPIEDIEGMMLPGLISSQDYELYY